MIPIMGTLTIITTLVNQLCSLPQIGHFPIGTQLGHTFP